VSIQSRINDSLANVCGPRPMVDKSDLSFRSVVFGTDFSDGARAGGRYAALFARHYHADLIVAHAFTLVQPALEVEALQHVRSQQRKDLEKRLSETVNSLAPVARGATGILGEGTPMHVIGETSARNSPCLIVLGTHGGSALERRIIGSVAEEILRTVWRPVLTVGPHVALPILADLSFRRILYATDFSQAAAAAAPYAVALAGAFSSEIDVMHVVSREAMDGSADRLKEQEEVFLSVLLQLVPEEAGQLCRSRTFVESGQVRDRIVTHAAARRIDLIVLGAHHHSRLAMHIRTGPAFQVIMEAPCPVLTITRT
jgi:nucleotide-binding universal stress UspA family protein